MWMLLSVVGFGTVLASSLVASVWRLNLPPIKGKSLLTTFDGGSLGLLLVQGPFTQPVGQGGSDEKYRTRTDPAGVGPERVCSKHLC